MCVWSSAVLIACCGCDGSGDCAHLHVLAGRDILGSSLGFGGPEVADWRLALVQLVAMDFPVKEDGSVVTWILYFVMGDCAR